jgi:hypothetical protein
VEWLKVKALSSDPSTAKYISKQRERDNPNNIFRRQISEKYYSKAYENSKYFKMSCRK